MDTLNDIISGLKWGDLDPVEAHDRVLALFSVSNSFISVGEKEPPKHKELLVQSPDGQNYLTIWRESYSIFSCQNKGDDSFDWKWKEI